MRREQTFPTLMAKVVACSHKCFTQSLMPLSAKIHVRYICHVIIKRVSVKSRLADYVLQL